MSINTTKDDILNAALATFLEKGFAGASISQIAKVAQVNQSLIYHHFESKEDLWNCVKKYCVDEAIKKDHPIRYDTLENFVHDLVEARFSVYMKEPMRRLVHWQALEPDTSQFYGNRLTPHSLFDISDHIKTLQENNLIQKEYDYQVLSGVVFSLASYAFFDFANAFCLSEEQRESYKKLACKILIQTLAPTDN